MNNIRILICDDHALLRSGMIKLLENEPGIFVIGEAIDGNDLITKYEILKPDLIITDISMPGLSGTDAVKILKLAYPDIKVLFVSMLQGELYIYYTLKVGGLGLIGKNIARGELLLAINEIINGRYYFGPHYDDYRINEIIKQYDNQPIGFKINTDVKLSKTEEKILELISEGLSSAEIADQLTLSKRTIDSSRSQIMFKFGMKSNPELVKFAVLYTEYRKYSLVNYAISVPNQP
jgi:two-component system, NarL family, response regulator NreC